MHKKSITLTALATLGVALSASTSSCAAIPKSTSMNIASGKTYTLSQKPIVRGETKDDIALTDGKVAQDEGPLWAPLEGALRWNTRGNKYPTITIDLGEIHPVSGVAFHTGGGANAGVYPPAIYIQMSADGKMFHTVGDLVEMSEVPEPPMFGTKVSRHWYRTNDIRSKGRYVRLIVLPGTQALVCDEIEIIKGDDSLLEQPVGGQVLTKKQLTDPLRLTQKGVRQRSRADLAVVRAAVQEQAPDSIKNTLLDKLAVFEKLINTTNWPTSIDGFKATLPVGDLNAKILGIYGELLATTGEKPLTLWHSDPYQMLPILQRPGKAIQQIELAMMQNEHRAQVFNITNASSVSKQIEMTLSGNIKNSITVYKVIYVDTREGRPVASPLIPLHPAKSTFTFSVPAGMTQQIWLDVDSADIKPGDHTIQIDLQSNDWKKTLGFQLDVAPLRMEDKMALTNGDWDYIFDKYYRITSQNQQKLKQLLNSHNVNLVNTKKAIPLPSPSDFDKSGNLVNAVDYSDWDEFIKFWDMSKRFFAVGNGRFKLDGFAGFKMGTPAYYKALAQWAADWAKHNQSLGLTKGQVLLLFVDEPHRSDQFQATAQLAKGFKQGTDQILILTDFSPKNMEHLQEAKAMLGEVDIIQPTRTRFAAMSEKEKATFNKFQQDKELWFYLCNGPTRQMDPAHYRMQPWHSYVEGAAGSGFWGFADTDADNDWNPYPLAQTGHLQTYSPIFIWPTGAATTKHWEAYREGLEDYQYLTMLTNKMGAERAKAIAQQTVDKLDEEYGIYYTNYSWSNISTLANDARLKILRMLQQ